MFQVYFENLKKRHEKILSSNEYGDTTTWIIKLIEMHNQHHIESNETIEKSQKLFHFGNSISSFGSDSVMPKVKHPLKTHRSRKITKKLSRKLPLKIAEQLTMNTHLESPKKFIGKAS